MHAHTRACCIDHEFNSTCSPQQMKGDIDEYDETDERHLDSRRSDLPRGRLRAVFSTVGRVLTALHQPLSFFGLTLLAPKMVALLRDASSSDVGSTGSRGALLGAPRSTKGLPNSGASATPNAVRGGGGNPYDTIPSWMRESRAAIPRSVESTISALLRAFGIPTLSELQLRALIGDSAERNLAAAAPVGGREASGRSRSAAPSVDTTAAGCSAAGATSPAPLLVPLATVAVLLCAKWLVAKHVRRPPPSHEGAAAAGSSDGDDEGEQQRDAAEEGNADDEVDDLRIPRGVVGRHDDESDGVLRPPRVVNVSELGEHDFVAHQNEPPQLLDPLIVPVDAEHSGGSSRQGIPAGKTGAIGQFRLDMPPGHSAVDGEVSRETPRSAASSEPTHGHRLSDASRVTPRTSLLRLHRDAVHEAAAKTEAAQQHHQQPPQLRREADVVVSGGRASGSTPRYAATNNACVTLVVAGPVNSYEVLVLVSTCHKFGIPQLVLERTRDVLETIRSIDAATIDILVVDSIRAFCVAATAEYCVDVVGVLPFATRESTPLLSFAHATPANNNKRVFYCFHASMFCPSPSSRPSHHWDGRLDDAAAPGRMEASCFAAMSSYCTRWIQLSDEVVLSARGLTGAIHVCLLDRVKKASS